MIIPDTIPSIAMFKPKEVARLFSVSPGIVHTWIHHGKINAMKIGGTIRIPKEDIIEFVNRRGQGFVHTEKWAIESRMISAMRSRVYHIIRHGNVKSATSMKLLGCTRHEFLNHIEKRFKPGMTWDNYGRNGWTIDHIIPCSKFDLSRPDHKKLCFHYTNLQPMWFVDNIKKNDKLTHRSVDSFLRNLRSIS